MQLIFLGLATAITALALVTHITIGTAQNAGPILNDDALPEDPRRTLIFSWRANSVLMFFMTIGLGTGFFLEDTLLVGFNAFMAAGLAILAAFVALQQRINPFKFPPMPLFACIAIFGLLSLV